MKNDEFPLAYFLTWTTYGTWLPGDERGWCKRGSRVISTPDPALHDAARSALVEEPVTLNPTQRSLVDAVIVKHCEIRQGVLHACNVRSNHIHIVVSAALSARKSALKSRRGAADDYPSKPAWRVKAKMVCADGSRSAAILNGSMTRIIWRTRSATSLHLNPRTKTHSH